MGLTAEDHLKASFAAYKKAFPSSKPSVALRIFDDGDIQCFLSNVDGTHHVSATGTAKTLDEAALKMRAHLGKNLLDLSVKGHADLEAHIARTGAQLDNLKSASGFCDVPVE